MVVVEKVNHQKEVHCVGGTNGYFGGGDGGGEQRRPRKLCNFRLGEGREGEGQDLILAGIRKTA